MTDQVRVAAQVQAELAYMNFMLWCKRTTWAILATMLLLVSCNFGVDESKYPNYNGAQYMPMNLKVDK